MNLKNHIINNNNTFINLIYSDIYNDEFFAHSLINKVKHKTYSLINCCIFAIRHLFYNLGINPNEDYHFLPEPKPDEKV